LKTGLPEKSSETNIYSLQTYNLMFTLIIALLLQLGTIATASDFKPAEYNGQTSTYQGQSIIIKDEIVY